MKLIDNYELVVGLEVHAELSTKSKIFCSCSTGAENEPNSNICPVCLGLPGALPTLNIHAVELGIKAGLALGCDIANVVKMDRKNYFYPDLPKAYQISQFDVPLCIGGKVVISSENGDKTIGITRIHIEEDAGKLIHMDDSTLIDYDRCGIPLIEVVSEPDIRSPQEASAYLKKLRSILVYAGVSRCRMNMGEFRCDVNLSVRKKGEKELGTRTEMKNLNSFAFVEKAIEYEYARQVNVLSAGGTIIQETRRFDQNKGITLPMRTKENAGDYRFFPEPDIPVCSVPERWVEEIRAAIPRLPDERKEAYRELGVSDFAAGAITADISSADYFEECLRHCRYPVLLSNLLTGDVFALSEGGTPGLMPYQLGAIADLLGDGEISSAAGKKLIKALWGTENDPVSYARENNLSVIRDESLIESCCRKVIDQNERSVLAYKSGKLNALKALVGAVMAETNGRADPVMVNRIMEDLLR